MEKKEIRDAVNFWLPFLLSKRIIDKLDIKIFNRQKLDVRGSAVSDDDKEVHPRKFTIELRANMRRSDLLSTLAHELVHIKQFAKNQNTMYNTPVVMRKDLSDHYWFSPAEIEAYGMEVGLYFKYTQKVTIESESRHRGRRMKRQKTEILEKNSS